MQTALVICSTLFSLTRR